MTLGAVSFSALGRPSTLAGGIPYADGTEYALLPAGTSGQVLQSNGAAAPSWGPGSAVQTTNTDTGTKNDWAPGVNGGLTVQPWNGAADLCVTGLSGLASGAVWIFKNIGTKVAYFPHLNGGSTAAHQFTNLVTVAGVGFGTPVAAGGWIAYYNDGTNLKLIGHEQGAWIQIPYLAGNFAGNGTMTWTVDAGDQTIFEYRIRGNVFELNYSLSSTTVGGTPTTILLMTLPAGFNTPTTIENMTTFLFIVDNGVRTSGFVVSGALAVTTLAIVKQDGTVWTASTNATNVNGIAKCKLT